MSWYKTGYALNLSCGVWGGAPINQACAAPIINAHGLLLSFHAPSRRRKSVKEHKRSVCKGGSRAAPCKPLSGVLAFVEATGMGSWNNE